MKNQLRFEQFNRAETIQNDNYTYKYIYKTTENEQVKWIEGRFKDLIPLILLLQRVFALKKKKQKKTYTLTIQNRNKNKNYSIGENNNFFMESSKYSLVSVSPKGEIVKQINATKPLTEIVSFISFPFKLVLFGS